MYFLIPTPILIFFIIYGIYKWCMRQSDREKEFWWDQKNLRGGRGISMYNIAKGFLLLVAIAGGMLILVSLIYGQVPTWHDFGNKKFLWAVLGAGFLGIMQFGFFGVIFLIKYASKHNIGKIVLFFTLIGGIATILITGICLAAF
jgi:hypothetical protein